jgi:hypothetical protein
MMRTEMKDFWPRLPTERRSSVARDAAVAAVVTARVLAFVVAVIACALVPATERMVTLVNRFVAVLDATVLLAMADAGKENVTATALAKIANPPMKLLIHQCVLADVVVVVVPVTVKASAAAGKTTKMTGMIRESVETW